jgi:hypothetical protein
MNTLDLHILLLVAVVVILVDAGVRWLLTPRLRRDLSGGIILLIIAILVSTTVADDVVNPAEVTPSTLVLISLYRPAANHCRYQSGPHSTQPPPAGHAA